jgi:HK97 family phage prohead protease
MPEFETITLTAASHVDPARRRIYGTIVPYDVVGHTSAGPTVFAAGSIVIPDDPGRVKMLVQHDANPAAVGVGASFEDRGGEVVGTFTFPPGARGDAALAEAASGLRDGLSVGVLIDAYATKDGVLYVTRARLNEVSLVTIPAFEDARVLAVAASQRKGITMTEEAPVTVAPVETPPEAEAPAEAVEVVTPSAAPAEVQAAAVVPPTRGGGRVQGMTLRAASTRALAHLRAGNPPAMLSAALLDFVPADDVGEGIIRPQFIGELWQASRVARPVIDAIRRGRLDGLTVVGWQWDERFEVASYAGNKAAIPSKKATTKAVTTTAVRFAGGLDIDRVFIDLGAAGLISDLFSQGTDSYRTETENYVVTQLLAAATAIPAAASLTDFLIAAGVQLTDIGARVDFVTVSADIWSTFAALSSADVPWWLDNGDGSVNIGDPAGDAGKVRFSVNPDLPDNTILGGDSRAATWYEVDPPIRVRAENIPNGGIDIGVFGYGALIINDARAVVKGSVTPPVPEALTAKTTTAK